MLQWLAASMCGLNLSYFPFADKRVRDLAVVAQRLRAAQCTVGRLWELLLAFVRASFEAKQAHGRAEQATAASSKSAAADSTASDAAQVEATAASTEAAAGIGQAVTMDTTLFEFLLGSVPEPAATS